LWANASSCRTALLSRPDGSGEPSYNALDTTLPTTHLLPIAETLGHSGVSFSTFTVTFPVTDPEALSLTVIDCLPIVLSFTVNARLPWSLSTKAQSLGNPA